MKGLLVAFVCVLVSGCVTEPLSDKGRLVEVMTGDPPKGCQELGVISPNYFAGDCGTVYLVVFATFPTSEGTRNCLRNMTADLGGNYFRLETQVQGTAFKCP